MSCSKFATDLSQESLCLLTSLLASAVFLLYSGLSSSFFEFGHFYMIFSLFLLIVLFGHPIFLNTFSCFVSLLFLNFHLLLILICFVSFFFSFSMSISSSFVLLKWSFTLLVYSHLILSSFSNLTLKNSSCFNGVFLLLLFNHHGGKFTFCT